MCTAVTYKTNDFYMGRTLDYDFSYGDEITVTPRNYSFTLRHGGKLENHYAIIGMAHVAGNYPLYYDAINEKGLCNALTTVQKDNLVIEEDKQDYVSRRYNEFIEEKGYVPEMFVAYNKTEIKDVAPTLTGQCSSPSGSSAVLKLEVEDVKVLAPNNWGHKAGDGTITRERTEKEIVPALQASAGQTQQSYLKVKVANKKGYEKASPGDYVNITYPGSKTKRGRVGNGVAHTLTCGDGNAVITENVRIRKLTPRECLRLMGWKDEQIDKIVAAKISGTQQYRQAGNGIVVQVLESIFKALFLGEIE